MTQAQRDAKTRRAIEETCASLHKHYAWSVTERARGLAVLAVVNDDPPVRIEETIDVRRIYRDWARSTERGQGFDYLRARVDAMMTAMYEACDKANTCAHANTFRARDGRRCVECKRRIP